MSTNTASEVVLRITGNFIEDESNPKPPMLEWIQAECRHGCFRETIEKAVRLEPEPLRSDLVIVEKVEPDKITLRIPARVTDHESPSTFSVEGIFELNPVTLSLRRV